MKRLLIILTLFLFFINTSVYAAQTTVKKDMKIVTKDGFSMSAVLEYPKTKGVSEFSTVVLLHSLGYSSQWWETLPKDLLEQGYAVLSIDLRGHGKSVYNSKLVRVSWKSMTNRAYAKYPNDVAEIIEYVKNENKRVFFNKWAFIGSDIGAVTAIKTANIVKDKPKTIVAISPVVSAKSLFVPVDLAELENIDIISIIGSDDYKGQATNEYLKKFAQSTYSEYTSESKSTGMLLLKNDPSLCKIIVEWVNQYLK